VAQGAFKRSGSRHTGSPASAPHAVTRWASSSWLDSSPAYADPSAPCDHDTPVHGLLFMAATDKVAERQQILRLLLQHGAAVESLDFCASPDNGDCNKVLLPILQEFESQRQPTRKSI